MYKKNNRNYLYELKYDAFQSLIQLNPQTMTKAEFRNAPRKSTQTFSNSKSSFYYTLLDLKGYKI